MKNSYLMIAIGVAALVVLGGAFYFLSRSNNPGTAVTTQETQQATTPPSLTQSPSATGSAEGAVKEFTVTSSGLNFNPAEIRVSKGDKVKITYNNTRGTHDLVIDEFNVKTDRINAGQSDTIEFVADQTGTFEYYCSVPGHREAGMVGKLIVE